MPTIVGTKYNRNIGSEFQATKGYVRRESWAAPLAYNAGTAAGRASLTLLTAAQTVLLNTYTYTVTSAAATVGAIYTDAAGVSFTVVATIAGATSLVLTTASATTPSTSGTLTKVSGTGDATITFASHAAVVPITQPDFARVLSITPTKGSGSAITGNVVITGTDIRNAVVTDTIACGADTVIVNGVIAFKTVTSILYPARTQASDAIVVGCTNALGLPRCMSEDSYIQGSASGTFESSRATIAYDSAIIAKNTVTFATSLNGTLNFVAWFLTKELWAGI